MKNIFKYFTAIIFTLTITQCSNPIEPPKPKVIKDPKDYTWTVDTLRYTSYDQTFLRRIWGDSPDNLYIVGHSSNAIAGQMWHYDGKAWSPVSLPFTRSRELYGIYGFSSKDVWAVGSEGQNPNDARYDSSYVLHYDGNSWKDVNINGGEVLTSVWGSSSTDAWTGGRNNLFHFDGTSWKKIISYGASSNMHFLSIAGFSSSDIYFIKDDATQYPYKEYLSLYHFDGQSISIIDSTDNVANTNLPKFGALLRIIDGSLYSSSSGLFKRISNNWNVILADTKIIAVNGTNSNHIFAAGFSTNIYYYDGNTWRNLTPIPGFNLPIYDIIVFDNEVFMVATDGWITYILHGK